MDAERQSYIEKSLSLAVHEFVRDYGIDAGAASERAAGEAEAEASAFKLGSLVGFKGSSVRGGLAFVAPASLVARTLPVPRADGRAELQLRDWTAEIANQLIGRLKNKITSQSFDFEVGTAVCFRGMSMNLTFEPSTSSSSLSAIICLAGVSVFLDCSFVDGATLPEGPAMRIVPEGDVLLF